MQQNPYPFIFPRLMMTVAIIVLGTSMAFTQTINSSTIDYNCFVNNAEKVYVTTPSQHLVSGQMLNYSAIVVNGATLQPSAQSKVLYLELTNAQNSKVLQWLSNFDHGTTQGSIALPDTLSEGIYTLKAYTAWMLNNGYPYTMPLLIHPMASDYPIQLAMPDMTTKAEIPSAHQPAVALTVTEDNKQFTINTLASGSLPLGYTVQISHRGQVIQKQNITNTQITVGFDKTILPEGILAIEIIDNQGNVDNAQLVYHQKQPAISIEMSEQNNQSIQWQSSNKQEFTGAIITSSITKADDAVKGIAIPAIAEYLNFQSEIMCKGYCRGSVKDAAEILRHTLYEHYLWNRTTPKTSTYKRESLGNSISGRITAGDNQPLANAIIYLSAPDTTIAFKYALTDAAGNFSFVLDKSWLNRKLLIQLNPAVPQPEGIKWSFTQTTLQAMATPSVTKMIDDTITQSLKEWGDIQLINNIFDTHKTAVDSVQAITPIPKYQIFSQKPSFLVKPADFEDLPDFEQVVLNIIPMTRFNKRKNGFELSIFSTMLQQWLTNCTLFLNGVPFNDFQYISTLNSKDIKQIEVFNTPIMYGDLMFNGILSVQTHKGHIPASYIKERATVMQINLTSPFISVNATPATQAGEHQPDFRQVISFQPFTTQTSDSKQIIKLTPSQLTGQYTWLLQGITANGIPFTKEQTITISNQ